MQCGRKPAPTVAESLPEDSTALTDTVQEKPEPKPGDEDFRFNDPDALSDYLSEGEEASSYAGGILPVIAEYVPEYADRLVANQHNGFIVVDKASMRVILYDRYGQEVKVYDMACAKNYGTKHKKADSRTPEGFFSVEGKYNSTDWLFTDDNGVQSKKKGQFGPRFIRIKIPNTSQIGIHGTCSPWSVGHRVSHGCIRITNEQIMELVDLVEVGMPVIILPGKKDRQVNREEGYNIPYFPTAPKYAMTDSEKKLKAATKEEILQREEEERLEKERLEQERLEQERLEQEQQLLEENGDAEEKSTDTVPLEEVKETPDSIKLQN